MEEMAKGGMGQGKGGRGGYRGKENMDKTKEGNNKKEQAVLPSPILSFLHLGYSASSPQTAKSEPSSRLPPTLCKIPLSSGCVLQLNTTPAH